MNDRMPIRDRTLVLRILVPGLETRLREKIKETETLATVDSFLDLDGVTCEPTTARSGTLWAFQCDGATYPAKLVNLPCPVEIHKTHDHAMYYKCADVAQMLIVYEDDMALDEASQEKTLPGFPSYHPSGLTPPMKRVVERRFAAREHKSLAPPRAAVAHVEAELADWMDALNTSSGNNTGKDDKIKRKKCRASIGRSRRRNCRL
jgi:transcription initiation factor TFIID subunit 7